MTLWGCRASDIGRGVNAGSSPIVEFLQSRLHASGDFTGRAEYLSPYDPTLPDTADMVGERAGNFLKSGNGMLFGAFPFQGIPIASSYEQGHDYLYYLFWTRYIMQTSHVRFIPNYTGLYQFRPRALQLAGVRYVVTRESLRQDSEFGTDRL